jgi:hypothetical protein
MCGVLSDKRTDLSFRITNAVIIGSEYHGPIYTPRHRVPFSSPLTARRAKVEVFKRTCTRGTFLKTE